MITITLRKQDSYYYATTEIAGKTYLTHSLTSAREAVTSLVSFIEESRVEELYAVKDPK